MARSEARLAVSIWTDLDFLALSPTAQRMFMFLLSQPDLAHDGVLALRERRWSKSAAGMTRADVERDLYELRAARFIVVDDDTEEMLIRSFIRRDKVYRQPNVLRAAADHLAVVSSPAILAAVADELRRVLAADDIAEVAIRIVEDMIEAIRKGSGNPSANPSGNPSGNPSPGTPGDGKGSGNPSGNPSPDPARYDDATGTDSDGDGVSAGVKGSGNPSGNPSRNPSGNPSAGTPGERGVVTAVSSASPIPGPRSTDPGPRPQSSTGGRAGVRETSPAGDADGPPPSRCEKHLDDPDPGPCGHCADARKRRERYDRDQVAVLARLQSERARQQAEATRAAIDACRLCDPTGYRDSRLCTHDPDQATRTRRGAAAAAAAIRRPTGDRP